MRWMAVMSAIVNVHIIFFFRRNEKPKRNFNVNGGNWHWALEWFEIFDNKIFPHAKNPLEGYSKKVKIISLPKK